MTSVWVLTGDTTTDCEREWVMEGKVVGVFASEAAAEKYLAEEITDTYARRKNEYTIEEFVIMA